MIVEEQAIEQAANTYACNSYGVPKITCREETFNNAIEDFVAGAKSPEAKAFHTKEMYSEEEVHQMFQKYGMDRLEEELRILGGVMESFESFTIDERFEQNKKK